MDTKDGNDNENWRFRYLPGSQRKKKNQRNRKEEEFFKKYIYLKAKLRGVLKRSPWSWGMITKTTYGYGSLLPLILPPQIFLLEIDLVT